MPRRYCGSCRSPCTPMTVTASAFPAWGNPMQMPRSLALIVLTANISLASLRSRIAFFSESDPAPRPPVFFLPGTCEEKTAGQRISAPGWERAHGSDPACLASPHREVLPSFFPNLTSVPLQAWAIWSRSGEVTMSWPMTACHWQLQMLRSCRARNWPRPLTFARAQRRQSRDGCRTFPCPLKSGWRAGFGVVSTRGALSQPSGWVVPAGAPSGPSATTAVLPWSSRRAHEILAPLTLPASVLPLHPPSPQLTALKKRVWEDASTRWVSGCTSLPTHCHRLEGEGQSPVQAMQDHFSARWTLLRFSWTGGFGAPLYGGSPGLSGQAPLCHRRVWAWSCDSQGAEKCNRPGFASHQDHRSSHREVYGQPGGARAPPVAHADGD